MNSRPGPPKYIKAADPTLYFPSSYSKPFKSLRDKLSIVDLSFKVIEITFFYRHTKLISAPKALGALIHHHH